MSETGVTTRCVSARGSYRPRQTTRRDCYGQSRRHDARTGSGPVARSIVAHLLTGTSTDDAAFLGTERVEIIHEDAYPEIDVFIPVYQEHEVIHQAIRSVRDTDYIQEKINLTVLLEPDDTETIERVESLREEVADQQTLLRRLLGDGFSWLAGTLLSARLNDYQCGAKAIDAESWAEIRGHLCEPGFAWDVELVAIAAALDLRIEEVPVAWEDQPGTTVSPVRDSVDLFRALLTARSRSKQLRDDRFDTVLARDEQATPLIKRQ